MSAAPPAGRHQAAHAEEPPPLLRTWRRLYLAVIGWLAVLILVFYLFARAFSP